jgi:hypothetical protein
MYQMDCKLVPYGEEERRCVKCGYITWNNEKTDKEIIDDMIASGYPVPNCRENTTKCECGANTSCQCDPEETNDSIEIDYSKVIKVQPRMVRESFPKEEPKQETLEEAKQEGYICPHTKLQCDDECCVSASDCHIKTTIGIISEPKQETLEEAATNYTIDFATMSAFKLGAKWQQEQTCNHSYILTDEQGHRVIKCSKCNDTRPI